MIFFHQLFPVQRRTLSTTPRASLTSDLGFKCIFKKNKQLLIDLLNDTLNEDKIVSLDYDDGELVPWFQGAYGGRLDVVCQLGNGTRVAVEVQVRDVGDFQNRVQFYASHMFANQFLAKKNYSQLESVILLSICAYNIFPTNEVPEYYSKHVIKEETTNVNTLKNLKWVFIELEKFDKPIDQIEHIGKNCGLTTSNMLTPGHLNN